MYSESYWANWGCRCCSDATLANYNTNWGTYQYWVEESEDASYFGGSEYAGENASCVTNWIGDGYCDTSNNAEACDFDGGDCCESTCRIGTFYACGYAGYDCVDPRASNSSDAAPSAPREQARRHFRCTWRAHTVATPLLGTSCARARERRVCGESRGAAYAATRRHGAL